MTVNDMVYRLEIDTGDEYALEIGGAQSTNLSIDTAFINRVIDVPEYTGEYEFTPTQSTQTINISGLAATQDITINPIPQNYGLITWDGSVLRIT